MVRHSLSSIEHRVVCRLLNSPAELEAILARPARRGWWKELLGGYRTYLLAAAERGLLAHVAGLPLARSSPFEPAEARPRQGRRQRNTPPLRTPVAARRACTVATPGTSGTEWRHEQPAQRQGDPATVVA